MPKSHENLELIVVFVQRGSYNLVCAAPFYLSSV